MMAEREGFEVRGVPLLGCDRCGENHEGVTCYPLTKPQMGRGNLMTHYTFCPTLNEPIFIFFYSEDEVDEVMWTVFNRDEAK